MWDKVGYEAERALIDELDAMGKTASKKKGFFDNFLSSTLGYDTSTGKFDPMILIGNAVGAMTGGLTGFLTYGLTAYKNMLNNKQYLSDDVQAQYERTLDRLTSDFGGLKVLKQLSDNADDFFSGKGDYANQGSLLDFVKQDALSNMYIDIAAAGGSQILGGLLNNVVPGGVTSTVKDKVGGILPEFMTSGVPLDFLGESWKGSTINPLTTVLSTLEEGVQVPKSTILPSLPSSIYKTLVQGMK